MAANTAILEIDSFNYPANLITDEIRQTALRMSFSLLRRWQCQMPPQEIEGITDLALCEAAKRYDPAKGSSFNTFVYYYIKAGLIKAVKHAVTAKKAVHALTRSAHLAGNTSVKINEDIEEEVDVDPDVFAYRQSQSPETMMLENERKQIVREALENLGDRHQRVLNLVYFQQAHPQKIAKELGVTKSALRNELERARNALYNELESSGQLKAIRV